MARYKELAEKYGDRLRQECARADYAPGRRLVARMLSEWDGTHLTEHAARIVIK